MPELVCYAICELDEIPSRRARGFYLLRRGAEGDAVPWPIFVVRWGRQVFGYVNHCPHGKVKLDWERNQFLDANGTRLICGKHGALFDLSTGECVEGPCVGQGLEPVALAIVDDDICVIGVELIEDETVILESEAPAEAT